MLRPRMWRSWTAHQRRRRSSEWADPVDRDRDDHGLEAPLKWNTLMSLKNRWMAGV